MHTPGAKAPNFMVVENAKAKALAYLEAKESDFGSLSITAQRAKDC
jgi:hypothetical protein